MTIKKAVTAGFVAGAVALAIAGANAAKADNHETAATDKEKCYGVVKAGHNDCGDAAKAHSCMGHATEDGNNNEWIALPAGVCAKLVGGSLKEGEGGAHACKSKDGCDAKKSCEGKSSCEGKKDEAHDG